MPSKIYVDKLRNLGTRTKVIERIENGMVENIEELWNRFRGGG